MGPVHPFQTADRLCARHGQDDRMQPVGAWVRHGPNQVGVDDREDREAEPQTGPQGEQRDGGEPGIAHYRATGVIEVPAQALDRREAALVAERLHRLFPAPGTDRRGAARKVSRTAAMLFALGGQLEMDAELLFQIGVRPAQAERSPQPVDPLAKPHATGSVLDMPIEYGGFYW